MLRIIAALVMLSLPVPAQKAMIAESVMISVTGAVELAENEHVRRAVVSLRHVGCFVVKGRKCKSAHKPKVVKK